MRDGVKELIDRKGLVLSDDASIETVQWVQDTLSSLQTPLQDEEAIGLLGILSRSDDTCYGLNWEILHYIETAPSWPIWAALKNAQGGWAATLKQRLDNAGCLPPI